MKKGTVYVQGVLDGEDHVVKPNLSYTLFEASGFARGLAVAGDKRRVFWKADEKDAPLTEITSTDDVTWETIPS